MNLIADYFPKFSELTDIQVQDMRSRLVATWAEGWPDLDTRPGSVFGDGVVTPLAYALAASEIAGTRIQSDLDLNNVAQGIIYSCDFVRAFLKNFAVTVREGLPATGIVRLTFSADAAVEINRGMKIRFGNTEDDVFYPRLFAPGAILIRPVGSVREAGQNIFPLIQLSQTQFAADIPVEGQMSGTILAGDDAEITETIENLSEVISLVDFDSGTATDTLEMLAEKTRTTFYAASFSQRMSAARFLKKEYPDLRVASVVMPGDYEMLRGATNPLGFSEGVMDVFVRSRHFQREESQTVRVSYIASQDAISVDRFIGKLELAGAVTRINSVTYAGDASLNLNDGSGSQVIYSRTKNVSVAPLLSAGMSMHEELWLSLKMPRAHDNTPLIIPDIDDNGDQFAYFTVSYVSDPMVSVLSDYLESSDIKPVGVTPLVRSLLPVDLSHMVVKYRRASGTTIEFESARQGIHDYLAKAGFPDVFSDARIGDIMYYAGAAAVTGIECVGRIRWTVADRVLQHDAEDPSVDLAAAEADAVTPPHMAVRSSADFLRRYRDLNTGTVDANFAAAGPRNTVDPGVAPGRARSRPTGRKMSGVRSG